VAICWTLISYLILCPKSVLSPLNFGTVSVVTGLCFRAEFVFLGMIYQQNIFVPKAHTN
jgi:hypothetical protein